MVCSRFRLPPVGLAQGGVLRLGEGDGDGQAAGIARFGTDGTAVGSGDRLDYGQPESGAMCGGGQAIGVEAAEGFKQAGYLIRGI